MIDLPAPDLREESQRQVVGLENTYTLERRGEIPALYQKFFAIRDQIENTKDEVLFGVSMNAQPDGSFRYGVGVEVHKVGTVPDGACCMVLSEGLYAVFTLRTPMSELPAHFDAVFSSWLPASDFVPREGAVFERYPPDPDNTDTVMRYEIWVPVSPKS